MTVQPYRVYSTAGRRRKARGRAASAVLVLLALALAWTWNGDHGLPGAGAAGGTLSREGRVATPLSPFSDEPPVARLAPVLREAVQQAASDARAEGVTLRVNGGWRSARYQRVLLRRAVKTYGSIEVARQYVLPPAESKHVTGEAVDVVPSDASGWLAEHGAEYGLCQIYANEPWHFELATTPGGACPPLTSNAAGR